MPTYDYYCKKCEREFSVIQSISEQEKAKIACPTCKEKKVTKLVSKFTAITSRKS